MKKMIIAAVSAVLALSVFAGCELNTKFTDNGDAIGKTGEITIDNVEKVTGGYWATAGGIDNEEKALYFNCGSWASYVVELKEGFNFEPGKKVTISIKAADTLTNSGTSLFKFGIKSSDTMVSEITSANNEDGSVKVKFIDAPVTEIVTGKYTEFTFNTSDMWTGWSQDGSITDAYKPYIRQLIINPQASCEGKIFINSIKIEDIK